MSRARKKKVEMNGNSLGVVLSSGALAGAERSGGEPGSPQRSAAAAKAGADPVLASRPDSEVVARPKRRTFTAEYKQRILTEAEAGQRHPRSADSAEARAEVQAPSTGRRKSEAATAGGPV
jgi:hypothetical protein